MECYAVIFDGEAEDAEEVIKREFPEKLRHEITPNVWMVASETTMPSAICEKVGFYVDGGKSGVVVRANSYNGYFSRDLWEQMERWRTGRWATGEAGT